MAEPLAMPSDCGPLLAVNAELIRLYWEIGALIHQRQQQEGWGAAVIPRLELVPQPVAPAEPEANRPPPCACSTRCAIAESSKPSGCGS